MFRTVDKYLGLRLGADLCKVCQEETTVVETERRLYRELGFGFIHVLWWIRFLDGRSVVSVPPGAGTKVQRLLDEHKEDRLPDTIEVKVPGEFEAAIDVTIREAGLSGVQGSSCSLVFVCDHTNHTTHSLSTCRQVEDPQIPLADGIHVPPQCIVDGVSFGVIKDDVLVAVAYAHRTGAMQDQVADVGVETTSNYRRQGFAKAAVSSLVEHFVTRGGQGLYMCSPSNHASIATATSVGFVPYAKSLVLTAPSS